MAPSTKVDDDMDEFMNDFLEGNMNIVPIVPIKVVSVRRTTSTSSSRSRSSRGSSDGRRRHSSSNSHSSKSNDQKSLDTEDKPRRPGVRRHKSSEMTRGESLRFPAFRRNKSSEDVPAGIGSGSGSGSGSGDRHRDHHRDQDRRRSSSNKSQTKLDPQQIISMMERAADEEGAEIFADALLHYGMTNKEEKEIEDSTTAAAAVVGARPRRSFLRVSNEPVTA